MFASAATTRIAKGMLLLGLAALAGAAFAAKDVGKYAILVSKQTYAKPDWHKVVDSLKAKYAKTKVFEYEKLGDATGELAKFKPRYVCVVAEPTENYQTLVPAANKLCRDIDPDPYVDAIWGILTGFDAGQALELTKAKAITVQNGFCKTSANWLNYLPKGRYLTEDQRNPGEMGIKKPGKPVEISRNGPKTDLDDAKEMVKLTNEEDFDMLISSGHGYPGGWLMMYPSGKYALAAKNQGLEVGEFKVTSNVPRIYWAVGNCLTGYVNGPGARYQDSYALAWMKAGAKQFVGAVESTWYGLNWRMDRWFFMQGGRYSFAESLFLLRQVARMQLVDGLVSGQDKEGTEYTDGIFVLYGDPALSAKIKAELPASLDEKLTSTTKNGKMQFTYTVKAREDGPWDVFASLLPYQVTDVKLVKSDFTKAVVSGQSIVWNAGKELKKGDKRTLVFTCKKAD
jgi:hypothetical protein